VEVVEQLLSEQMEQETLVLLLLLAEPVVRD
jgi:hypothetical protein